MDDNVAEPLIFPMAHCLGKRYNSVEKTTTFELPGGLRLATLTLPQRDVWILAHGLTERLQEEVRWTRSAVLQAARPLLGSEADSIVEELMERDVLVETTPGTEQAIEFAKEVRLVPLRWGGGNSEEEPWMWRIGLPGEVIRVTHTIYNTWAWSHAYTNLWESCKALADINSDNPEIPEDSAKRDPTTILTEVLNSTHALLSTSCAYLDIPFRRATA